MGASITEDPDFPGYDSDEGDPFDAAYLHRRAQESPNDWRGWIRLGYLLSERGEDDAIPALERALALAPGNGLAHYLLGRSRCAKGQRVRGTRELETAVRLRPDHARGWTILAALRLDKGRVVEALEALLIVATLAPDGETYWDIARCFMMQHRFPEAIAALEEAMRLAPNHVAANRVLSYLQSPSFEADRKRHPLLELIDSAKRWRRGPSTTPWDTWDNDE